MGKKAKLGKFRKDKFYKLAKETGFRSRAAFKLIQLNRKFGFLQESQVCIDLCAAPGGWMQVAKQNMPVSSIVIGVDLYPIRPIPGCISLIEDITTDKCKQSLTKELQSWKADCVLHDGAPNVGKNWLYDAYQQICLTLNALKLSTNFLRKGGWFITKVFRSKDYNALLWVLKQLFKKVHATKPSASRKESAEIFIVCQFYLAPEKIDSKLLDPKYVFEELDLEGKKQSTLLHPDKQKRIKAEGYTEKDISSRSEISVTEFMENKNALAALQGVSSIKIDHNGVRNHPRTTSEIVECCKDIKVLGRKDVKSLLNWWKHVKADLFKEPTEDEDEKKTNEEPPRPLTEEEIEEKEFEELEEKILELEDEERREEKRKRKKIFKEKAKLSQKMNLKMVIKGDQGPTEQAEDEIFDLREIKTKEDLENLQDISPDYVEEEQQNGVRLPKYKKFDKDNKVLDDEGRYEDAGDSAPEESDTESESDYDKEGLGLSDEDDAGVKRKKKLRKKKKQEEHPLIKSSDFRDKDTKRKQRVQLWFEKENLQKFDTDDDEDFDLDKLANEYKNRGVAVLGEDENNEKKVVIKRRHSIDSNEIQTSSSDDDDDDDDNSDTTDDDNYDVDREMKAAGDQSKSKEPKTKKIRLTEKELAIGSMMVKGRKTKRDLIDLGWNRYAFNDENLPTWFVQDEELHMRKDIPVPAELTEEYENKVRELNVRPIKKVMEAKARKKKRALKRLAKAQKKAEQILDNADASAQEKMRQIKKLYKKAEDKKKELTYVVAKKHLAGKRVRRPPNVKGRFKVVDPRMKKDKRAEASKQKKSKGKKK